MATTRLSITGYVLDVHKETESEKLLSHGAVWFAQLLLVLGSSPHVVILPVGYGRSASLRIAILSNCGSKLLLLFSEAPCSKSDDASLPVDSNGWALN